MREASNSRDKRFSLLFKKWKAALNGNQEMEPVAAGNGQFDHIPFADAKKVLEGQSTLPPPDRTSLPDQNPV